VAARDPLQVSERRLALQPPRQHRLDLVLARVRVRMSCSRRASRRRNTRQRSSGIQTASSSPFHSRLARVRESSLSVFARALLGVLARRGFLATPDRPTQRLLAQDHGPERIHRTLPPCPGMLSEPPGADPHAGWCGRGQDKPGLYPIREGGVGKRPARAPRRRRTSAACHPGAIQRRWTRERVLEAMAEWVDRYGRLPSSYDWSRTHARRRGEEALRRLNHGCWPSASVVTSVWGSRSAGCARYSGR
jgi:hypothetical protein